MRRPFGRNYAFVVAGVTFAALLVAARRPAATSLSLIHI